MSKNNHTRSASAKKLVELVEKNFQRQNLETMLADLQLKIGAEIQRLNQLEEKAQDEFEDVEVLKTQIVPQFLYKTFGDLPLDEKIQIEELELIEAQTEYFSASESVELLQEDAEAINQQLKPLANIHEKLARLGRRKQPASSEKKVQHAYKIAQNYAQIERIHSAIQLGKDVVATLKAIPSNSKEIRYFKLLEGYTVPSHSEYREERNLFKKGIRTLIAFEKKLLKLENGSKETILTSKPIDHQNLIPPNEIEDLLKNTPKFRGVQYKAGKQFNKLMQSIEFQQRVVAEKERTHISTNPPILKIFYRLTVLLSYRV